jgi:hypothetical protein
MVKGDLVVTLDRARVDVDYDQDCTVAEPCTTVSFPLEVEPGEHQLSVEFTRGDGTRVNEAGSRTSDANVTGGPT